MGNYFYFYFFFSIFIFIFLFLFYFLFFYFFIFLLFLFLFFIFLVLVLFFYFYFYFFLFLFCRLDFFFSSKSHAKKFSEFLGAVVPVRTQTSEKLISHDIRSNTANFKHSFSVEIVPICRDDFVCLPPSLVKKLGGVNPLYICYKVTNSLHLIDPTNLKSKILFFFFVFLFFFLFFCFYIFLFYFFIFSFN